MSNSVVNIILYALNFFIFQLQFTFNIYFVLVSGIENIFKTNILSAEYIYNSVS